MKIKVQVCVKCYYWPINGDEFLPACKQCGHSTIAPSAVGTLENLYRAVTHQPQQELIAMTFPLSEIDRIQRGYLK